MRPVRFSNAVVASQIAVAGYAIVALGDKRCGESRALCCAMFQQQHAAWLQMPVRAADNGEQIGIAFVGGYERLLWLEAQLGQRRITGCHIRWIAEDGVKAFNPERVAPSSGTRSEERR